MRSNTTTKVHTKSKLVKYLLCFVSPVCHSTMKYATEKTPFSNKPLLFSPHFVEIREQQQNWFGRGRKMHPKCCRTNVQTRGFSYTILAHIHTILSSHQSHSITRQKIDLCIGSFRIRTHMYDSRIRLRKGYYRWNWRII